MNNYQKAKLDSYKLIVKESLAKPATIALIPKFQRGIERLGEINVEIEQLAVIQEKDLKGIALDKGKTIDQVIDLSVDISGALHSYAQERNDLILMDKVNFPASSWEKMDNSDLLTNTGIVVDEMRKVPVEAMAEEGISPEEMQQLEDLYNEYNDVKLAPREAVIDRSGATARLTELFSEAFTIVKGSLDKLATQFKRKDPDYYFAYKAARSINYRRAKKATGDGSDEV